MDNVWNEYLRVREVERMQNPDLILKPGRLYVTRGGGRLLLAMFLNGRRHLSGFCYSVQSAPVRRKYFADGRCLDTAGDDADVARQATDAEREAFERGEFCTEGA